jgi:hypothetical protein
MASFLFLFSSWHFSTLEMHISLLLAQVEEHLLLITQTNKESPTESLCSCNLVDQ